MSAARTPFDEHSDIELALKAMPYPDAIVTGTVGWAFSSSLPSVAALVRVIRHVLGCSTVGAFVHLHAACPQHIAAAFRMHLFRETSQLNGAGGDVAGSLIAALVEQLSRRMIYSAHRGSPLLLTPVSRLTRQ